MTPQVLYAIEGFDLVSGNKTAGFSMQLMPDSVRQLAERPIDAREAAQCNDAVRETLARADLLPHAFTQGAKIAFYQGTMLPLAFIQDPIGGSLGLDHGDLHEILERRGEAQGYSLPYLEYSAHNVDSAKQALALSVILQVWAEWARAKLAMDMFSRPEVKATAAPATPT